MKKYLLVIVVLCAGCSSAPHTQNINEPYRQQRLTMEAARLQMQKDLDYRLYRFELTEVKNEERATPLWIAITAIRAQAKSVDSFLELQMSALIDAGGGYDSGMYDVKLHDRRGEAYDLLVKDGATSAVQRIRNLVANMLDVIEKYGVTRRGDSLGKKYKKELNGELVLPREIIGQDMSIGEALAVLAGVQLRMTTLQVNVIGEMMGQFEMPHGCDLEHIEVISQPYKTQIKLGEEYVAEMFLAVTDPDIPHEMQVNGKKIEVQYGHGIYRAKPAKPGMYKWKGTVTVPMADGARKEYSSRECTYTVTP